MIITVNTSSGKHTVYRYFLSLLMLSIALVAIGIPVIYSEKNPAAHHRAYLSELTRTRTNLSRSVSVLKAYPDVVDRVNAETSSIESLSLGFMEVMEQQVLEAGLKFDHYSVKPNESEGEAAELHSFRVEFSVSVEHTAMLLPIFDALKTSVDWRPVEVKRCHIVRIQPESNRVQASCVVDIYYFPGVDS